MSGGRSVLNFLIFQKGGFESTNSNLSITTKFILPESLLQEVIAREIQIDYKGGGGGSNKVGEGERGGGGGDEEQEEE